MKRTLNIFGRLVFTAATVGAIGFGFVALNPPDEAGTPVVGVKESGADIFGMSFADRTSTQKFQASLSKLGHESPRVFDVNGNTVMFSTNQMRGTPDEVVKNYMRVFAEEELNPYIIEPFIEQGSPLHQEILKTGISGGVLPWTVQEEYFALGGGVIDADVKGQDDFNERVSSFNVEFSERLDNLERGYLSCGGDKASIIKALNAPRSDAKEATTTKVQATVSSLCEGGAPAAGVCDGLGYQQKTNERRYEALVQVVQEQELLECGPVRDAITAFAGMRYDDYTNRIKAFRSIEGWYNKKSGVTQITATWSDESFDMKKMQPSRYGGVIQTEAAEKVPLCPGCKRTWAFQGTGPERPYTSNLIYSPREPSQTANFYINEMVKEGWEIPEAELVVREMDRINGTGDIDNQWVRFRRGDENLAMNFKRDSEGRTVVNTATAP